MSDAMNDQLAPDVTYGLAIDEQVEKFVELKQKLTYFLITASVVVIAFVVKFAVDNLRVRGHFTTTALETSLVIALSLSGLATSGCSLFNIHFEHRSYRLHLQYSYQRKKWDELTRKEQAQWDRINDWAAWLLRAAFVLLFVEIGLAVAFFISVFA